MNTEDAETYFSRISNALLRYQLNWVFDQVDEQIRFGKVGKTKEVTTYKDQKSSFRPVQQMLFESEERQSRGKKEKYPVVTPYSSQEKLVLLIDAIERLLIETVEIYKHVIGFVSNEKTDEEFLTDISFVSDETGLETLTLSKVDIKSRTQAIQELKPLLDELRRDATNNDN